MSPLGHGTGYITVTMPVPLSHSNLMNMKQSFIIKQMLKFFLYFCLCTKRCFQEMVWIEPDKREYMTHMEGGTIPVCGGAVAGCVWVDPVGMKGVFARADSHKPRLF